jgi:hypothetical protein
VRLKEGRLTMKRRTAIIALLGLGVCVVVGALIWRFAGPFGPARKLVGDWEFHSSELADKVREALEKNMPEIANAAAEKFRSTERLSFHRNGIFRDDLELLGLTITTEGTWKVTGKQDGTLSVTVHKKRLTVHNPQKGETQEKAKDELVEWAVTVIDADHLSVTRTADGKNERFSLRRAKD